MSKTDDVIAKLLGTAPQPAPTPPVDPDAPQWYCLRSQLNGLFCTSGMQRHDDGHLEMVGPVLVFFDRADAEREAVAHRETYPWLLIQARPLPAAPPDVCRPLRHADDTVIATQVTVARGDAHVCVEVRTTTLTDSADLAADLLGRVVAMAGSLPSGRVGPVRVVVLGPVAVQIGGDTIPAASDQEAA